MLSLCALAGVCLGALSAEANIQSNRWFYEMTQDGRDVHLTLQLIEEEPPNFDTTFMLVRGDDILFQDRQFVREEADETVGPNACIEDSQADGPIADCDGDGTADCAGTCGTAYRYGFTDECVPEDSVMYRLFDESTIEGDGIPPSDGYYYIYDLQPADDACLDTDSPAGDTFLDPGSCSIFPAVGASSEALAALMLLVGLGFVVVARRRKGR
jgi:hypothetical protein